MPTIKVLWSLAKGLAFISTVIWILQTGYFLIMHGWHIQPINEYEVVWDGICSFMFKTFVAMLFIVIYSVLDKILED